MKKFVIEEAFWKLFPQAKIGVVIARDIDNTYANKAIYEAMLLKGQKEALRHIECETLSENQVVSVWREAFKKFKTKKGARSSIEALLKRVSKGNAIGTINPLVDIYNSCSLMYALPNGGEDIDTFEGDIRLTLAAGSESFVTLGSDKSEPPLEGELIYKDDAGAVCRCWNWREAVRTMLTEETNNAFLCVESVDQARAAEFEASLDYLKTSVEENLGGTCTVFVLDIDHPEIAF